MIEPGTSAGPPLPPHLAERPPCRSSVRGDRGARAAGWPGGSGISWCPSGSAAGLAGLAGHILLWKAARGCCWGLLWISGSLLPQCLDQGGRMLLWIHWLRVAVVTGLLYPKGSGFILCYILCLCGSVGWSVLLLPG